MPAVSVIIPNYNHAQYLRQRIDCVLAQSFRDFELIIIDDNSTDGSRDIIDSYRDNSHVSKIIYNDAHNDNPYGLWAQGIERATGKWIWIAACDDHAAPGLLAALLTLGETHENTGIAFCGSHWVDDEAETGIDLSIYKESFYRKGTVEIRRHLSWQCSIQSISAAIIRLDLAQAAITGLQQYQTCGDWIFYTRILHQASLVFTAQKLNYFRWYHHTNGNGKNNKELWLKEGISVLSNINLNKIKFSFIEFVKVIKFWSAAIYRSANNMEREKEVLSNFIKRYFKLIKKA